MSNHKNNKPKGFGKPQNSKKKVTPKVEDAYDEEDSEIKEWIQEQLSKNLSVEKFNQEFSEEGWSLTIKDGIIERYNGEKQEKYPGTCLFLEHNAKQGTITAVPYDENNPKIPDEIFEEIAYW